MTVKRFITAFIICGLIITAVLAMVYADISTRQISGDHSKSIFSYEKINYCQGRLELFGTIYTVDLEYVEKVKEKFTEIYTYNLNFIPDFILNTAEILGNAINNAINSLQIDLNVL